MSYLLADQDVDVVRFVLKSKDGATTLDFAIAQDYYHGAFDLWADVWPVLAQTPIARRAVGSSVAIRQQTEISVFGKSYLWDAEHTFVDLLKAYEFHSGKVYLYYFALPYRRTAAVTVADSNLRQTLEIVSTSYDDQSGTLTVGCRDTWFRDKEITPRLTSADFPGLPIEWENEVGPVLFGSSTAGVVTDAPIIESDIWSSGGPSPTPYAKLFGGWTTPTHPNGGLVNLYVQNRTPDLNATSWLPVHLATNPQATPCADITATGTRGASLGQRSYGLIYTPTAGAEVLTSVGIELSANLYRCGVDVAANQFLRPSKGNLLTRGDDDFSISFWIRFNAAKLSNGAAPRYLIVQGRAGKRDWFVYFATGADDKPRFAISADGTTVAKEAVWSAALSASTLYHIVCWHNATTNYVGIAVNNGTPISTATAGVCPAERNGVFSIGPHNSELGLEGQVAAFGFWDRIITAGEITTLYNGGSVLYYDGLDNNIQADLTSWWDLDEQLSATR